MAVDGLSLAVRRGEVLGLLGPNGAGKSTTVNLAVGLLAPDAGRVIIEGKGAPTRPAVRAGDSAWRRRRSRSTSCCPARRTCSFFGDVYGLPGARLTERVAWSLDFVGLTDRRRDRVATYSGGMKRRLNLAAALVHDPELILLDEPTVGVDPQSRNQIFDNILALKAPRAHVDLHHALHGRSRTPLRSRRDHRQGQAAALGTVPQLLDAHGVKPKMVLQGATLEEVFLHLTGRSLRD